MLQTWKSSYLETRQEIESSKDFFIRRWEFDKSALFSETDYITDVLQDIMDVLKVKIESSNLEPCRILEEGQIGIQISLFIIKKECIILFSSKE